MHYFYLSNKTNSNKLKINQVTQLSQHLQTQLSVFLLLIKDFSLTFLADNFKLWGIFRLWCSHSIVKLYWSLEFADI